MLCFFIPEDSNLEKTDTLRDNSNEIIIIPSACDKSTQTENVLDSTKEQAEDEVFEEQGGTLPRQSQSEIQV